MFLQAVALVLLAAAVLLHGAQTDAVCTDPTQTWVLNSIGQSPCLVAEKLAAVCIPSGLTLPLLASDTEYYGPTADQNNNCQCTTVFYSLVSACAACQDKSWINFNVFVHNCTQIWAGVGISLSTNDLVIPSYAFLDVRANNTFNEPAAISAASASSFQTPSSSIIPKPSDGHSNTHKGALIGIVIGGVALLMVVGVLVWMFRRRRRRPIALPTSRLSKHYIRLSESGTDWMTAPKPAYQPKKHSVYATDTFSKE